MTTQTTNIIALGFALLVVIINGLIGHFFAPNGILLTPIILIITSAIVCFRTKNLGVVAIVCLTFLYVALNDISIKLYSGGKHDNEGLVWVHFVMFVGLLPSFGMLLMTLFRRNDEKLSVKLIAVLLFIGLIVGHLYIFGDLGLGRYY